MKYFLQRDGRTFGPYSFDDLKRYQSEGRIGPDDEIRAEDSERWIPQREFFVPPAAAPTVPVPPIIPPAPEIEPQRPWTPPDTTPQPPQEPANPFAAPGSGGGYGAGFGVPGQYGSSGSQGAQQPYGNPGFGPPSNPSPFQPGYTPPPGGQWPSPPDLHWAVVLLIGILCGLFTWY